MAFSLPGVFSSHSLCFSYRRAGEESLPEPMGRRGVTRQAIHENPGPYSYLPPWLGGMVLVEMMQIADKLMRRRLRNLAGIVHE